jgi:4-diphosphocytidyl-2-C-methyl-D-erythritol kinase
MSPAMGRRAVAHERVVVHARAKLNLGLAVGPRRADGFHDLVTVFQSVSLADTLTLAPRRRGFTLEVRHENAAARGRIGRGGDRRVPSGAGNLVLRAARALAHHAGLEGGARFTLIKRIPSRAGLGGGSADAAAALAGLARLYGIRAGAATLHALALELGSDVPFALRGGTVLGLGRGDRLTTLRLAMPFRAVIAVPSWGVDTLSAYRSIDRDKNHLTEWSATLRFAQVLGRERVNAKSAMQLGNSFESVLGRRRRELDALRARMHTAGVRDVLMTGSGSAVFGLLPPRLSSRDVMQRFVGREAVFFVRSAGRGLSLVTRS